MSTTAFSYAQAARGRTLSQPSPQQTSSPAPSTAGSHGKDDASTGATSITAPSVASNSAEVRDTDQSHQPHAEGGPSKQDSESASVAGSGSSVESAAEQQAKPAQEGGAKSADAQTIGSADRSSRSNSRTARSNDSADVRKSRKGKKSRGSDKDAQSEQTQDEDTEKAKEPVKPPVLTEAPPPAVNPWAKRMEAQKAAAKAKLASASPEGSAGGNEPKQGASQEEAGAQGAMSNGVNGDKSAQKKPADAPRAADQAPRTRGPRGSRANDNDERSAVSLPVVADPSSWPDPKAAAEREQPARKPQEKPESAEKDHPDDSVPSRKKAWVQLELDHAMFKTQFPPRGSKPRGGARGGRDAGSMRGSHANAANAAPHHAAGSVNDKTGTAAGGSAGPRAAANRPREGSIPTRSASQTQPPHASKRVSVDGITRDQRKQSVPGSAADSARDHGVDASSVSSVDIQAVHCPLPSGHSM